jgi:multiple sugar transport system substrate-binding protein
MKKSTVAVGVLTAGVMALSLVPFVSAQDDVTLTWRTRPDNQAEIDVYTSISQSVDEMMEGVTLEYQAGGTETAGYQDTLLAEFAAGTAPDVFWIPGTDVARFAQAGAILNLADLAAADPDFDVNVFYPQQVQELTYNPETMSNEGALWGLPRDASSFALYFNQDLFDEAGIDNPIVQLENGEWTWESFQAAAEAIAALGDDVYGIGMNAWWANPGLFINAAGSSFFNEDRTACGLDNEGTTVALTFLQNLYALDGVAVPYGTDAEPPFISGNLGMFLNGRWATPNTIANAEFNWDVAEVPFGPEGQSNWLFWGAYVVNANTEHPEQAFELLQNLTSTEVQAQVTALGANIPSRNTPEAIEAFLNSTPGLNNAAFTNALQYAVAEAPLWAGSWPGYDGVMGAGITEVLNGAKTPEEFTSTICQDAAEFFNS